jgi:hypothetical protein
MASQLRSRRGLLASLLLVSSHSVVSSNAISANIIALDASPPPALPTGCLNNSFINPTWTVESFSYNANQILSTVNFLLTSNTIDQALDCFGEVDGSAQNISGDCTSEDDDHQYSASFSYAASTRNLTLHQEWTCSNNTSGNT